MVAMVADVLGVAMGRLLPCGWRFRFWNTNTISFLWMIYKCTLKLHSSVTLSILRNRKYKWEKKKITSHGTYLSCNVCTLSLWNINKLQISQWNYAYTLSFVLNFSDKIRHHLLFFNIYFCFLFTKLKMMTYLWLRSLTLCSKAIVRLLWIVVSHLQRCSPHKIKHKIRYE